MRKKEGKRKKTPMGKRSFPELETRPSPLSNQKGERTRIKESVSGEATAAKICAVRKTQAGNVLVEMRGKAEGKTDLFESLKAIMGENVNDST